MTDHLVASAGAALLSADYLAAMRGYARSIALAPERADLMDFNLMLARRRLFASLRGRRGESAIFSASPSLVSANLETRIARLHRETGTPMLVRLGEMPESSADTPLPMLVLEHILDHPCNMLHLTGTTPVDLLAGLLGKLLWNATVLVHLETDPGGDTLADATVRIDECRQRGALNWLAAGSAAAACRAAFDGVTVELTALNERYDGILLPPLDGEDGAWSEAIAAVAARGHTNDRLPALDSLLPSPALTALFKALGGWAAFAPAHTALPPTLSGDAVPARTDSDYAVLIHVFHMDLIAELRDVVARFDAGADIYVSYPDTADDTDVATLRSAFEGACLIPVRNVGQDIGAFIQILNRIRHLDYNFFCKLHSKKGDKRPAIWRRALFDGVAGTPRRIREYIQNFRSERQLTIGGPKELFLFGPEHVLGNETALTRACEELGDRNFKEDWGFFAGTCFWINRDCAYAVADLVDPDTFDDAPVKRDGQLAHALERLFGRIGMCEGTRIALASTIDPDAPLQPATAFPQDLPRSRQYMNDLLAKIDTHRALKAIEKRPPPRGFERLTRQRATPPVVDVTVFTPTGDRHAAFAKCIHWMTTQTVRPRQWVIVDDGRLPLDKVMTIPDWATYIRRARLPSDPPHTLSMNILAGLYEIENDSVVIMEDDDWYAPHYVEYMAQALQPCDMVGLNKINYYLLREALWKHGQPPAHTALAQTAFRMSTAGDCLRELCEKPNEDIRVMGVVDRYWWNTFNGRKWLIKDHGQLHLGLKGGFGRPGLAEGHKASDPDYKGDSKRAYLPSCIGDDHLYYRRWHKADKKRFAIYTAVAGGFDNLKQPLSDCAELDFYAFTDHPPEDPGRWDIIPLDEAFDDPVRTAKKPKILPHLYFPEYEWSIWVDANLFILQDLEHLIERCIAADAPIGLFEHPERNTMGGEVAILQKLQKDDPAVIGAQFDRYVAEGWDNQRPLYECNFLVRRHNDPRMMRAMNAWWREIGRHSRRDQISFPYVMWQAGIEPLSLLPKGRSTRNIAEIYYPLKPTHGHIEHDSVRDKIAEHCFKFQEAAA